VVEFHSLAMNWGSLLVEQALALGSFVEISDFLSLNMRTATSICGMKLFCGGIGSLMRLFCGITRKNSLDLHTAASTRRIVLFCLAVGLLCCGLGLFYKALLRNDPYIYH